MKNLAVGIGIVDVSCAVIGLDVQGVQVYDSTPFGSTSYGPTSQTIPAPLTPPQTAVFFTANCTIPATTVDGASHVTGFLLN